MKLWIKKGNKDERDDNKKVKDGFDIDEIPKIEIDPQHYDTTLKSSVHLFLIDFFLHH